MNQSLSARWARQIIAALVANNVRDFFVSPGGRSAPLAMALAEARDRGEIGVCLHYDERGLAFAALGASRALGRPTACLTTSGSAVAHLMPACIEAFHSGIPLILLTADRPPELRDTGANQTIRQPGIFGVHARAAADIPPPCEELLPQVGAWISRVLHPMQSGWPGPVHLNIPFGEPLLPETAEQPLPLTAPTHKTLEEQDCAISPQAIDFSWFEKNRRGLIIVGELAPWEQQNWPAILRLAGHLGWPVAADALSGGKGLARVLQHLDFLLQMKSCPGPECVLHLGGRLVSRRVQEMLAGFDEERILQVRRGPGALRMPGQRPEVLRADPADFCARVMSKIPANWSDEWRTEWENTDQTVEQRLAQFLDSPGELGRLSEPALARWLARHASQSGAFLFLGNSMPVRDFDAMAGPLPRELRVFGQRGASGIDGNIAHIAGFARASGRRVVALLGDLAVLHDLNSLALLSSLPVALLVANNQGGGIFQFLPLDMPQAAREEFLETPHQQNFAGACAQFGIAYTHTASAAVAEAILRNQRGPALIELPSNRRENLKKHRDILRFVLHPGQT